MAEGIPGGSSSSETTSQDTCACVCVRACVCVFMRPLNICHKEAQSTALFLRTSECVCSHSDGMREGVCFKDSEFN